ncbi:MAG: helix-turn-helix domain-containing protein, partial [Acidimicrobiales bacterium]
MAERGRPKAPLTLTDEERQTLQRWSRRAKTAQALALRARIVLACAEGATNKAVAEQLGIWPQTVGKWRGRFVAKRLEGLSDEDRPGRPRTIADERVERVITKTLEEPPPNQDTHWSTRSMARATAGGSGTSTVLPPLPTTRRTRCPCSSPRAAMSAPVAS